jgi:hypothetical protein
LLKVLEIVILKTGMKIILKFVFDFLRFLVLQKY